MKKFVLSLFLLMVGTILLQARPIDRSLAMSAAQKFVATQFASERALPELVYTGADETFFVYNVGNHSFVIIAGDDAHRPFIAYSDESSFDASNIPPALTYYLDGVAECTHRLRQSVAHPQVAAEWASLLEHGRLASGDKARGTGYFCQTKWDQSYPYNYCCPEDPNGSGGHAIVGCLATAMSQLMRFWAYPAQGIGDHCYYHEDYGQICADFGNTTYDWDNMPDVLSNNATEAEMLATGTLCFHCGVTIDMGWPMYYGGCQDGGCHAFICDGYDDNDYFHFNLGWGGGSNGWYLIDDEIIFRMGLDQETIDMMAKIRKEDPAKWDINDIALLHAAVDRLKSE